MTIDADLAPISPQMSAIVPPDDVTGTLRVHLREIKLVSERLMMVFGVPYGSRMGARQFIVAACGLDPETTLDGLVELVHRSQEGEGAVYSRPEVRERASSPDLDIDFAGGSVLPVGHLIVGLLAARSTRGPYVASVRGADTSVHLHAVIDLLDQCGVGARIRVDQECAEIHVEGAQRGGMRPAVTRVWKSLEARLVPGTEVSARTWWTLYYASNRALTVDTEESRYHTGDTYRKVTPTGEHFIRQNDPLGRNAHRREIFIDAN